MRLKFASTYAKLLDLGVEEVDEAQMRLKFIGVCALIGGIIRGRGG